MFIAIEGIDGLGKTTLCKHLLPILTQRLSCDVVLVRDPDDSPFGTCVRDLWRNSQDGEAVYWPLMFAAASTRAQAEIPHSEDDLVRLSDRCALSTFAYCFSPAASLLWIDTLHAGYRYPDLTIYLDIDPHIAAERLLQDSREFEATTAQLQTIREKYWVAVDFWKSQQRVVLTVDVDGSLPASDLAFFLGDVILNHIDKQ
jgi:dTMP kinase